MQHHVYFWLKEEKQGEAERAEFEKGLGALLEIEEVGGGLWGKPAKTDLRPVMDQSWDYALSVDFDTKEQHDRYQVHAEHDVFVEKFKDWWAKVLVMDVEA